MVTWRLSADGRGGAMVAWSISAARLAAGERGNGFEHALAVAERNTQPFGLLGKDLGVLPQSKLFEPGSRTSH
jgi:hypothetical protein